MTTTTRGCFHWGIVVALCFAAGRLDAQVRLRRGVTLRSLEAAATRDSNDTAALYDLALGYWSKERWDDAEHALTATLAIEPRNAPALLALAHLPYARRPELWDEVDRGTVPSEWQPVLLRSDRQSRLAFTIDPLVDLQIVGAVAPDESSLLRGRPTPERTAAVGLRSFRNGQYSDAFAWFDRLARLLGGEQDPSHIPDFILWYRGLSAAHLNDYPSAIRDFRLLDAQGDSANVATRTIDPALATYILGTLLQHTGALDEAVSHYERSLTRDFTLWMAHVQLAKIHDDRHEWPEAIRERRLAIDASPDDATLLLDLGITLSLAGRPDEAATALQDAGSRLPRNYRIPYFQGLVALQLQQPGAARTDFQRFLALVPSRFTGQIAEVRGRLDSLP